MDKTAYSSLHQTICDFDKIIEQVPGKAINYCSRGMIKYTIDDIDGAFTDWIRAAELGYDGAFVLMREAAVFCLSENCPREKEAQ